MLICDSALFIDQSKKFTFAIFIIWGQYCDHKLLPSICLLILKCGLEWVRKKNQQPVFTVSQQQAQTFLFSSNPNEINTRKNVFFQIEFIFLYKTTRSTQIIRNNKLCWNWETKVNQSGANGISQVKQNQMVHKAYQVKKIRKWREDTEGHDAMRVNYFVAEGWEHFGFYVFIL